MGFVFGYRKPNNEILGNTFAGIITQIGDKVTKFKVGDWVWGTTEGMKTGTHAEYICLKENGVICLMPPSLSFNEAAAIPFGAQTAVDFLKKANL